MLNFQNFFGEIVDNDLNDNVGKFEVVPTLSSSSTTTTIISFFHRLHENIIFASCEITQHKNYCTCGPTRQNWHRMQQPTCNVNRYLHIDDTQSAPFPFATLSVGQNQHASVAKRVDIILIKCSQNGLMFEMLIFITVKRAIFLIFMALLLML